MGVDVTTFENRTSLDHLLGEDHGVIKGFLLTYNALVILFGLTGNLFVFVGSVRYGAIRMDPNSVILLENVAVADMLAAFLQYVPMLVTLAAERWVLGPAVCYCGNLRYIPFCYEAMLIAIMSCHRVRVLASPLRSIMEPSRFKKIIGGLWVFYAVSLFCLTGINTTMRYEPTHLNCSPFDWENIGSVSKYLRYLRMISGMYLLIPVTVTVVANIAILYLVYSSKEVTAASGSSRNFKAVKTVSLICWVYIVSYLPTVALFVLPVAGVTDFPPFLNIINSYILSLNLIANPIIYSFTNKQFACFAKKLVTCNFKKKTQVGPGQSRFTLQNGKSNDNFGTPVFLRRNAPQI